MEISLEKLEWLLNQQKRLVVERLLSATYMYNAESTDNQTKHITNIDKEKFEEYAMRTKFPNDVEILKNYNVK